MKLTEFKGEKAIEVIGELLEPISTIAEDEKFKEVRKVGNRAEIVQFIFKKHAKEIHHILAIMNDVDVKDYNPTLVEMFNEVNEAMNDEELLKLFK